MRSPSVGELRLGDVVRCTAVGFYLNNYFRSLAIVAGAAALTSAGCRVYDPSLVTPGTKTNAVLDGGSGKGAQDADTAAPNSPGNPVCALGECWWSSLEPGCPSAGMPKPQQRPVAGNASNAAETGDPSQDVAPIYLGWTQLRISARAPDAPDAGKQSFGLDLDGTCTNSATCPGVRDAVSCRSPSTQIPFDAEQCRDNSFANIIAVAGQIPEIGKRFGLTEDMLNCSLWRGSYNMIARIVGYNGKPDDENVRVDWYTSNGLESPPAWQCPNDDFRAYPAWRASAHWRVDASELVGAVTDPAQLPDSRFADTHAYVKQGYLVSQLPNGAALRLVGDAQPFRGFSLPVHEGLWIGRLFQAQDSTWRLADGLTAGRTTPDEIMQSFRQIGFCKGVGLDTFQKSIENYVVENADVLISGEVNPQAACDALSFGIAFEAAQITPGSSVPLEPPLECCAPGVSNADCRVKCGDGMLGGDERCDTAIADGKPGACPKSCAAAQGCNGAVVSGDACDAHCVPMQITAFVPGDGCCPDGADAAKDRDCLATCGNGVLELGETCDPSSSCTTCRPGNACVRVTTSGSAETCNAACAYTPIMDCVGGDGCCPRNCSSDTDGDCSIKCGNSVLDKDETCEANTATPCPASCDDGDACTRDIETGSATTCSLVCSHVPITQLQAGDKCCPKGANANTDPDCVAACGNGFLESGEQCDDGNKTDGDGCKANCMLETPLEQCLRQVNLSDTCSQCVCSKCASEVSGCYGGPNPTEIMLCDNLVKCVRQYNCSGLECYCGRLNLFFCSEVNARGDCQHETEAAAKSTVAADIIKRVTDVNYPLGRVNVLGQCAWDQCASSCGF